MVLRERTDRRITDAIDIAGDVYDTGRTVVEARRGGLRPSRPTCSRTVIDGQSAELDPRCP